MTDSQTQIKRGRNAIELDFDGGSRCVLPYLWLRDNCDCGDCRIAQTSEKRFMLTEVPADLEPGEVDFSGDELTLVWPDGHRTTYAGETLRAFGGDKEPEWTGWPANFTPLRFDYRKFLESDRLAARAIGEFLSSGVVILERAPTVPGTLEDLAPRLGPIREVLFARIHNVEVDPRGYNVAHTALPLPPHNDFASYTWPPSVQALHMLVNEVPGGESIVVDGWSVLQDLRAGHPDYFEALCATPVPFREFDDDNETFAIAPIVRCDPDGRIAGFRFSNQLMQPIDPNLPSAAEFYRAYHELCGRVTDPAARSTFRLHGGEILVVAAHRVLHGREPFEPCAPRRLQDAYFEFDNVRNHLAVLRRKGVI